MKQIFTKKLIFLFFLSLILISGCSFSGGDNTALKSALLLSANNLNSAEKVRINLDFETPRGGTIFVSQELTDLIFSGTRTDGETFEPITCSSKEELCAKEIWLHTGEWSFYLEGKIDGVTFNDKETVNISEKNTSITFNLTPHNGEEEIHNGGLYFVLNFTGDADSAVLSIENSATGAVADTKEYTGLGSNKKIEYLKTFKEQDSEGLAPGTYKVILSFYHNGMKDGEPALNTWKAYARIKAGLTARTQIDDYSLTDSYTITYHDIDGTALDSSGVVVLCYSRKSGEITLPIYVNAKGLKVLYWYETENFDVFVPGIKKFESTEKLKNLDFYPLWDTDTVYAANGGTGNGLTPENAVPDAEKAFAVLQKLHEYGSEQKNLTVQISGEVTGGAGLELGTDFSFADSITFTGKAGNSTDKINSEINMKAELPASFELSVTKLSVESIKVNSGILLLKTGAKLDNAEVSAKIKMGGDALITGTLTMNTGTAIELTENLTQNPAATITPNPYINNRQIIAVNEFTESNSSRFALTPHPASSDSYRWRITEKGVLVEEETGIISIKVYDEESDIVVTQTSSVNTWTFTAAEGYDSYEWKIDGSVIGSYPGVTVSENVLTCDTATWLKGKYDVFLSAKKGERYYSYHAQITKT